MVFQYLYLISSILFIFLYSATSFGMLFAEEKKLAEQAAYSDLSSITIDTISITGSREKRARIAGSAQLISQEELEKFKDNDVHQVLKKAPGVYVRGEDGYGLRPNIGMRGANSDRSSKVTLMEDGVLLAPAPYSAPAAYFFPMMAIMTGVEVFKGPASIRHGPNTIGGAINLQTREIPNVSSLFIDVSGGNFATYRLHGYGGVPFDRFQIFVDAARLATTGFKEMDGSDKGDTGFIRNEGLLKLRYHTDYTGGTFHQFNLKAGYSNEDSKETYLGLASHDFEKNPYRRYSSSKLDELQWQRTQLRFDYFFAAGENIDFSLILYRHDMSRDWLKMNNFYDGTQFGDVLAKPTSSAYSLYYDTLVGGRTDRTLNRSLVLGSNGRSYISQGIQSLFHWRSQFFGISNELEVGARFHNDSIERRHTEKVYYNISNNLEHNGASPTVSLFNRGLTNALALHLHDQIIIGKWLIAPGLRMESIKTNYNNKLAQKKSSNTNHILLPGLGVHYQVTPMLGLLAGVHRGFSPVSPGQPQEVKPELSTNYETGMRLIHKGRRDKLHAEVIGFYNDYTNITNECTFSSGCLQSNLNRQYNGGAARVLGFESMLSYARTILPVFSLSGALYYTYTASRFEADFPSTNPQYGQVKIGDELPYLPRHQLTGTFGFVLYDWTLNLSISYVGTQRDISGQGAISVNEKIDAFYTMDLATGYKVLERGKLYMAIRNLTNQKYIVSRRPFGARPGSPLQVQFGFEYLL